jgi:hypothetical protein
VAPAGRTPPRTGFVAVGGIAGGALLGLGMISAGGFIIFLPAAAVVLGLTFWRAGFRALAWVVLGVALVPLWVAFDNRGGPDWRCTPTPDGEHCRELADPAPWLTAGLVILAVAAVVFVGMGLLHRSAGRAQA